MSEEHESSASEWNEYFKDDAAAVMVADLTVDVAETRTIPNMFEDATDPRRTLDGSASVAFVRVRGSAMI